MTFKDKDIKYLDKILEWKLKKHAGNKAYGYNDEGIRKALGIDYDYYKYLINIIADYSEYHQKIVRIERFVDSIILDPLKFFTEDFVNSGGFKRVQLDSKKSLEKTQKKERRENYNIKTENFKNTIWIVGFIISVVVNVLYLFGILDFSFIKPRPEIKEIKETFFKRNDKKIFWIAENTNQKNDFLYMVESTNVLPIPVDSIRQFLSWAEIEETRMLESNIYKDTILPKSVIFKNYGEIYRSDKFKAFVLLRIDNELELRDYKFIIRTYSMDWKIIDSFELAIWNENAKQFCFGSINKNLIIERKCQASETSDIMQIIENGEIVMTSFHKP